MADSHGARSTDGAIASPQDLVAALRADAQMAARHKRMRPHLLDTNIAEILFPHAFDDSPFRLQRGRYERCREQRGGSRCWKKTQWWQRGSDHWSCGYRRGCLGRQSLSISSILAAAPLLSYSRHRSSNRRMSGSVRVRSRRGSGSRLLPRPGLWRERNPFGSSVALRD